MKKILLLIFIILFIGCNSSKENSLIVLSGDELYNKDSIVLFGNISTFTFLNRYPKSQIISSKESFAQIIDDLNQSITIIEDKDNGIRPEKKAKWVEVLSEANIDFDESNVLIARFITGSIFDIKIIKTDVGKDKKIVFKSASPDGRGAALTMGYIFIYKVQKNTENIIVELFPLHPNTETLIVKNIIYWLSRTIHTKI